MYHLSVNSDITLIMFVVPVWLLSVEQFNLLSFRYFHSHTDIWYIHSFISGRYFHLIFVHCTTHTIQLIKYKLDLLSLILAAICAVPCSVQLQMSPAARYHSFFRAEILCTLHCRLSRAFFTLCCVVWYGVLQWCSQVWSASWTAWRNVAATYWTDGTSGTVLYWVMLERRTQLSLADVWMTWPCTGVLVVGTLCAEITLLSVPHCHSTVCSVHWVLSPRCPVPVKLTVAKATGSKRSSKKCNHHHTAVVCCSCV